MQDIKKLLYKISRLKGDYEKELADSVLEVALRANKTLIEEWKGDDTMSEVLMELLEPMIQDQKQIWEQKGRREGRQEGKQEGKILGAIDILRSLEHSDEKIKTIIMEKYNLLEEEAEKYL